MADADLDVRKLGSLLVRCHYVLGNRAHSLSYWSSAVIAKSKTSGLIRAVCFKAETVERKMHLKGGVLA